LFIITIPDLEVWGWKKPWDWLFDRTENISGFTSEISSHVPWTQL